MVKSVEYMIPAVQEKIRTPAAFLVKAIKIIPVPKHTRISEPHDFLRKKHAKNIPHV